MAEGSESQGIPTRTKIKVWWMIARQKGFRIALKAMRNQLEERLVGNSPAALIRWNRFGHLAGIAVGIGIASFAPSPWNADSLVKAVVGFTAVAGLGVAIALRSLALFLASFSAHLLVRRFAVPLGPTLLRLAVLTGIGIAALTLPWPLSAWAAGSLIAIAWAVSPLLLHALVAAQAPRHISQRMMPLERIIAMSARKLSPEAKKLVATHEAGHAVFFGLGDRVPEDIFAWMDDEVPSLEDVASGAKVAAGGAVGAFDALAGKHYSTDLKRNELLAMLGMLAGGAAAEILTTGEASAGMVMDISNFEPKARLFLSLYPDPRWPYTMNPAGEQEAQSNALVLTRFRLHILDRAVEFLEQNRQQMDAVAGALLQRGELDVEDLRKLLVGVKQAGEFERFTWPADVPAMAYASDAIA
jgi:hypothetical protein